MCIWFPNSYHIFSLLTFFIVIVPISPPSLFLSLFKASTTVYTVWVSVQKRSPPLIKRIDTEAGRSFGLARLRQKWLIKRSAKCAAYSLALCLSWHLRGKNILYCKVLLQAQVYHIISHTHTHKNFHIVLKFWNRKFCSMTFYNRILSSLILNRFLTQNEPRKIWKPIFSFAF